MTRNDAPEGRPTSETRARAGGAGGRRTAAICALALVCACGGKTETPPAEPPPVPLSVLELPVSLRTTDAAPADSRKLEITLDDLRVDDQRVLKLEGGKVPKPEQADGVITKLKAALSNPPRMGLALSVHASLPYETAALALNSAAAAGMHQLWFRVRNSGGSTQTGWLAVNRFQMTPRTDDEVVIDGIERRKWDEFGKAWQAMHDACRSSQTGSCPFVENNVAQGGDLQIVLFASGSGVNLHFFRVGLTPADLAAEEQARKQKESAHKEDFIQGRMKKTDLEQELAGGEPATQALFQFRAREATDPPSVLPQVMQPLCGQKACGAVVSADSSTLMVRVISLIGAAFSEGAASPSLAFEMPWTQKPKPVAPPPPAAEPEPPAKPAPAPAHGKKSAGPAHKKKH